MALTGLALAFLLVGGCDETVTHKYSSRADAEKDRLFDKGWLPAIIPRSSSNIVTRNDLDLNTSRGSFDFAKEDLEEFLSHLIRLESRDMDRFEAYSYKRDSGMIEHWIFLIDLERHYCRYEFEFDQ